MSKKLSQNLDRLTSLLKPFGLNEDEALVYTFLVGKDELSALEISRKVGISRTKVYEILEKLANLGLISISGKENARRFFANSHKHLEMLVNEKKAEAEMLESSLPSIFQELASIELGKSEDSEIRNYKGLKGLKTVTWNSTKARNTLRVFELAQDMSAFLDFDFAEKIRKEFVRKGLRSSRQLTNTSVIRPWTNISEFTQIWEPRFISPKKFKITTEILVYNNVTTMYQLRDKTPFCVEIYNKSLSQMIKNLFDFTWESADKMKKTDERGSARVA